MSLLEEISDKGIGVADIIKQNKKIRKDWLASVVCLLLIGVFYGGLLAIISWLLFLSFVPPSSFYLPFYHYPNKPYQYNLK